MRARLRTLYPPLVVATLGVVGQACAKEGVPASQTEPGHLLPTAVDLRSRFEQWGLSSRSQGRRPTCSVFTFAGALEFALANRLQRGERLSVEYLNWAANQTGRGVRDGGFFSDMWNGFSFRGICAESQMPYAVEFDATRSPAKPVQEAAMEKIGLGLQLHWIKKWDVKTGLSTNQFAAIKQTLSQGWPVCAGLRWPKHERWQRDVLQMCPPELVFDGHSVLLVGFRDDPEESGGGVLIFRNTNHGGRDGFMPYAYAQAYVNDALWIESQKPGQD